MIKFVVQVEEQVILNISLVCEIMSKTITISTPEGVGDNGIERGCRWQVGLVVRGGLAGPARNE
jgi:hypothetical protein